jgi:hypothetical protein
LLAGFQANSPPSLGAVRAGPHHAALASERREFGHAQLGGHVEQCALSIPLGQGASEMNRRFRRRSNASLLDAQIERASVRCYTQESGANETSTSVKKPERSPT